MQPVSGKRSPKARTADNSQSTRSWMASSHNRVTSSANPSGDRRTPGHRFCVLIAGQFGETLDREKLEPPGCRPFSVAFE